VVWGIVDLDKEQALATVLIKKWLGPEKDKKMGKFCEALGLYAELEFQESHQETN
jgi:hypothetical protein